MKINNRIIVKILYIFIVIVVISIGVYLFQKPEQLHRVYIEEKIIVNVDNETDLKPYSYPFNKLTNYETPSNAEFVMMKTRYPFSIMLEDHGDLISRKIKSNGVWDLHKITFIERFTKNQPFTFVDVGANIGSIGFVAYTLGGRVILVEPIYTHIAMMRETAIRSNFNDPRRLTILPFAFSNQTGSSTIEILSSNHGGSTILPSKVKAEGGSVERRQVVIQDTLDRWINFPVDILKIDVEGMEKCVIEGALRLFFKKMVKCVMLELWTRLDHCNNAIDTLEWIENQGYIIYPDSEWESAIQQRPPIKSWRELIEKNSQFIDLIIILKKNK
jgi:FkbM family methyltransferase